MNGILKVQLVDARSLKDADTVGKIDPYVLIQYKDQKLKSKVAKDQGSNPVWNDQFSFWVQYPVDDEDYTISLKVMDKDTFTSDDFLGETKIDLKDLVEIGAEKGKEELQPRHYKVIDSNKAHAGEIQVAFTFTLKDQQMGETRE